jgi:hypothetical protein
MTQDSKDPRSVEEKARADLKRNSDMGMAVPETEGAVLPSGMPDTEGEHENVEYETGMERENRDDPLPSGI